MGPNAVILSPHFDDAALSCWHVLASTRDVLVVNVFASEPPAGTLGWWDRLAGVTDSAAAVRMRIAEDRRALALAGCTTVNLPFLDDQYRRHAQPPGEIVESLRAVDFAGARVYAPASLGDCHPDHTAVLMAALALRAEGVEVVLYADLPHATIFGWPRWVLDDGSSSEVDRAGARWASQLARTGMAVERIAPAVHRLPAADHAGKLAAVFTYGSQIAPLRQFCGSSSLEDPRLLGIEVTWPLALVA